MDYGEEDARRDYEQRASVNREGSTAGTVGAAIGVLVLVVAVVYAVGGMILDAL